MPAPVLAPAILALSLLAAAPAHAAVNLPMPAHLAGAAATDKVVLAARRYAAFWQSGDPALARLALADDFNDRTLPAGRAQGLAGPLQASDVFHAAVPDLQVAIEDMLVAGDRVSLRLHFTGRFTGVFPTPQGPLQGQGQAIDFHAFDLYQVNAQGRISDNWHLEDNLTLLRQLGVLAP
ncbi:ester cyclase [Janthinobacterium lividum]|uniref:ester cyclase n=1 Tax=Janthinobacterium lividum TaxID=29581 RepID=UPI0008749A7F|nr:ester cyclase [Janthinobacterium lividum]MCC7714431.1 ester cyclase [Janthinobacterium lividum]OEZ65999.1 snoaL-like polyketide cyclase [Janthinobacterium lividum]WQE30366.1 ester cyclase [Janthinobacterium lividum]STQ95862.1 Predicted ester cyclase [Janthinobacterium lividum]